MSPMKLLLGLAAALLLVAVGMQTACTTSGGAKATSVPTNTPVAANPTWTPFPTDTETSTVSSTSTRTVTRTYTPSNTPTPSPTPCNVNPSPVVAGTPVTVTVDCWNGGGCAVCGVTSYACITSITSSCTFTDPCPGGLAAVQVSAAVNGLSCTTSGASIQSAVNGTPIGADCNTAYMCNCSSCTTWYHTSQYYSGGFPGWVAGGTNTYAMTVIGQYCMSNVVLTVGCE